MYSVDRKDRVVPIADIPQSSVGAPIPIVLSDELVTVVAFYLQDTFEGLDGTWVRVVGADTEGEPLALIRFSLQREGSTRSAISRMADLLSHDTNPT